MTIVGALRVKNEARWIRRSIESILPICERVHVFDDNSTDDTREICESIPGVQVLASRFPASETDEVRDKNILLDLVDAGGGADWVVMIDGDEVFAEGGLNRIAIEVSAQDLHLRTGRQSFACLSVPILYLWNGEDQIRTDGVYGDYMRESVFRYRGERFESGSGSARFHCGNVPAALRRSRGYVKAPLLHFGYMHAEDRLRKFAWYRRLDPHNRVEDGYRHMVIGDLYPADSKFRHGGPLELRPL